jgi:hypothetical protein
MRKLAQRSREALLKIIPIWSFFSRVGNSKTLRELARWFVFVPFLVKLIAMATLELGQVPKLGFTSHFYLPFDWQLLYYSAFCFMLASSSYEATAPRIFRDFSNYLDLSQNEHEPKDLIAYLLEVGKFSPMGSREKCVINDILGRADEPRSRANLEGKSAGVEEVEQALHSATFSGQERIVLYHIWTFCNGSRPFFRAVCFSFYVLGFSFLVLAFASDLHAVIEQSRHTKLDAHLEEVFGIAPHETPKNDQPEGKVETKKSLGLNPTKHPVEIPKRRSENNGTQAEGEE